MRRKIDFGGIAPAERSGIPLASIQIKPAAMVMGRAFTDDPFFTFVFPDSARRGCSLPWTFDG